MNSKVLLAGKLVLACVLCAGVIAGIVYVVESLF
jgi:hypothetical protein